MTFPIVVRTVRTASGIRAQRSQTFSITNIAALTASRPTDRPTKNHESFGRQSTRISEYPGRITCWSARNQPSTQAIARSMIPISNRLTTRPNSTDSAARNIARPPDNR